jgi:hypothetical protein
MSDYRNPNDPLRSDTPYDPNVRGTNATWGWIAGAVFLVVVLAIAFGIGHSPNQSGTNVANNTPPATQMAPAPNGPANPAYTPAPMSPRPAAPQPAPSNQ